MPGRLLALLLALVPLPAWAAEPQPVPSPAGSGAMGAALATGPDGTVWLSWLEPVVADGDEWQLRLARFDASSGTWGSAATISRGRDWFVNWADFPQLVVQEKRMTAVWFVENPAIPGHAGHHGTGYHACYATSADGGATWTEPAPVTRESTTVEFVALLPLPGDHLLAAWLDGRQRATGNDRQALYSRLLHEFPERPDRLLDDSVCDCCQIALTRLPQGRWLIAYRDRTAGEIRDIVTAMPAAGGMTAPVALGPDGWKIAACPVNGPRLATHGDRVTAAWFTGAAGIPKVQVAYSADAGRTFGPARRIDLSQPVGRVDLAVLPGGRTVVTWLESANRETGRAAGLYWRELRPDDSATVARLAAPAGTGRAGGFPRLAPAGPDRFLVVFTRERAPSRIETLLVSLE